MEKIIALKITEIARINYKEMYKGESTYVKTCYDLVKFLKDNGYLINKD